MTSDVAAVLELKDRLMALPLSGSSEDSRPVVGAYEALRTLANDAIAQAMGLAMRVEELEGRPVASIDDFYQKGSIVLVDEGEVDRTGTIVEVDYQDPEVPYLVQFEDDPAEHWVNRDAIRLKDPHAWTRR